ncbi:mitogen activated protein kinase 2, variant 2 [Batrachochytrium dendrobatidis]
MTSTKKCKFAYWFEMTYLLIYAAFIMSRYLVQELMEADLHQIIRSAQALTDAHYQYFIYQICRGLKYIHSANVLHRDLKPGKYFQICDFGLARGFSSEPDVNGGFMTEYVATRWYRAPEIMLAFRNYTKAIDMWSVGCIFAELLGSKPLFKGRDYVDQLNQILSVLGTPDDETLSRIGSDRAQMYIRSLPQMPKIPFVNLYSSASELGLEMLEGLLKFDPATRMTVDEALVHPYLEAYHDPGDEPVHDRLFDFSFEIVESMDDMRKLISAEIREYKHSQESSSQMGLGRAQLPLNVSERADGIEGQEDYTTGAMDVDEELRMRDY